MVGLEGSFAMQTAPQQVLVKMNDKSMFQAQSAAQRLAGLRDSHDVSLAVATSSSEPKVFKLSSAHAQQEVS